uniref:Neprosin PEP catalytic domain-containing protein n=1 Tax=Brassica campestris TaxID=3711 RepID=M4DVH1_BRACM
MALVMNLLSLLFSGVLVHSGQSTVPLKSFKIGENVTYDCIDIHLQPGLDHPLLKYHRIQLAGVRSQNGPFRGVEAWFKMFKLDIANDQASYGQIYIGSGSNTEVNFISAGWMINPSFFGDSRTWTYGFWKGKDGKGCYNTACSGFVQVSQTFPIVQPIDFPAGQSLWLHYSIHEDKNTGNWWLTELGSGEPNIDIGYWPKELFNLLDNGANMVGAGGVVQASSSGSSPEMGNGRFPNADHPRDSGIFTNVEVMDSNYVQHKMNYFPTEVVLDSPKCYRLTIGENVTYDCIDIYMQSGLDHPLLKYHTIQINPSFFGDSRTWTYGFWKGKDGKGCYNTACSGFVQVSQTVPIVQPIDVPTGQFLWLHYSIHQDKNTGNWWITELGEPNIDIGYWPKELFNLLDNGAIMVGAGGVVQASRSGSSPEMGNGQFPNVNHPNDSAIFTNIEVLDSNYVQRKMNYFPTEVLLDSPKCYGLTIGKQSIFRDLLGFYFNYGGLGGNSCGI